MGVGRSSPSIAEIEDTSRAGRVQIERALSETRTELDGARVGMESARTRRDKNLYQHFAVEHVRLTRRERELSRALARLRNAYLGLESAAITQHTLHLQEDVISVAKQLTSTTRRTVKHTLGGSKKLDELGEVTGLAADAAAELSSAAYGDGPLGPGEETGDEVEDPDVRVLMQQFDGGGGAVRIEDLPHAPRDNESQSDLYDRLAQLKART